MSDQDKPKLGMRAPLGVRRTVETGKVKQSFSHGRSNTVIVETKKARVFRKPGDAPEPEVVAAPEIVPEPVRKVPNLAIGPHRHRIGLRDHAARPARGRTQAGKALPLGI